MTRTAKRELVRVGTRGSALALAQAHVVAAAIEQAGPRAELVVVETAGDRRAPDTAWGEGAFVAAIEQALLDDRVDVAVHSAKDIPTEENLRLFVIAFLARADTRDALVVRSGETAASLETLRRGSRVGTDSPRRTGFLLARRPDLRLHPLHGNVDTRLRRLDEGDTDALVIAVAGLERLDRADRIGERLDPSLVPPAPGQGAIAVQVRSGDERTISLVRALDDGPTRISVEAEREFLRASGGGCRAPIGALAALDGEQLEIIGGYAEPDGSAAAVERVAGAIADRDDLVQELVGRLSTRVPGVARALVPAAARTAAHVAPPMPDSDHRDDRPRVLLTRAANQALPLAEAIERHGVRAVLAPAIMIRPAAPDQRDELRKVASDAAWIVVTSPNGAESVLHALSRHTSNGTARWAAVGPGTEAALQSGGVASAWKPTRSDGATLGAELPIAAGDRVLVARVSLASPDLPAALRDRGANVTEVIAYRTVEGPKQARQMLRAALRAGMPDAALFMSGSAVRGLVSMAEPDDIDRVRAIPAICVGLGALREAESAGFPILAASHDQDVEAVAELVARAVTGRVQRAAVAE